MPPGVPVATVGVDGAKNAGILAAQILGVSNQDVHQKLVDFKVEQKEMVLESIMHSFDNEYNQFRKNPLLPPNNDKNILLHTCCAPCCGEVIQSMIASGLDVTLFFYNPNIHPIKEYELRKLENIRYAEKTNIPFIDADYDTDNWFERIKGLENEPERGERCTKCFDMRFERTALYAAENGYTTFTSSLEVYLGGRIWIK